jgi:hypothetical protein
LTSSSISPKAIHKQYDGRVTIPTGASGMSSVDNETKSKQRKKVNLGTEIFRNCICVSILTYLNFSLIRRSNV